MSKLEVDAIEPQSGTTLTLGASGDSVTLGSGASVSGLTLSDNILFDTASKGIYLGVTSATASNLLDDYEEGTWTPTYVPQTNSFTSITYDPFTEGNYTKIGRMVVLEGRIRTDAITVGTATGDVFVGGFPFIVSLSYSVGNVTTALAGFTNHPRAIAAVENTTTGILKYRATSNTVDLSLQVSDLGTGANENYLFPFTITYFTT